MAFSEFLRLLEGQTDRWRVRLVKARPGEVEYDGACRIYRVTLSIEGTVPDILQYVSDLTHGQAVIGLDGLSLRALSALNRVECTLSLRNVRLVGGKPLRGSTQPVRGGEVRIDGKPK